MRIKLRYSSILFCLILMIIIFDCYIFRLFKIDDNICKTINLVIVGIILFICFLNIDILKISIDWGKFIYYYIGLIFVFMVFEYAYTTHIYGNMQTFYEYAKYNKEYVFVLLAVPLNYIFVIKNDIKEVMDSVLVLVTITLGLMLLHAFLYNMQEIELLNVSIYTKTFLRNGRIRICDLSSLEGLAILYGTYQFLCNKRKKMLYLVQVIICIVTLVYVEQTRMMLVAIMASIFFMIIIKSGKTSGEILIKIALITLIGVLAGFYIMPKLIASFDKGGYGSISYRLLEIQFVINIMRDQGIFGMGMIGYGLQEYLFYHGLYSNISLNDIGIIGYVAQTGVWSIGLFLFPMLRMLWIIIHGKKDKFKIFLWSVYMYLIVTSSTLLVLNSKRILMWPFCLSLFEFYNNQYGKKTKPAFDKNIYEERLCGVQHETS